MKLFSAIGNSFRRFFARCRDFWYVPASTQETKVSKPAVKATVKRTPSKVGTKRKSPSRK